MTKTAGKKKRSCKCKIRGILKMWREDKDGIGHVIDYYDYGRYLRKFKYCPICGKGIS